MSGKADEIKGRVKEEAVGDLTDDQDLKDSGKADKRCGQGKAGCRTCGEQSTRYHKKALIRLYSNVLQEQLEFHLDDSCCFCIHSNSTTASADVTCAAKQRIYEIRNSLAARRTSFPPGTMVSI
jgi:uncharacterized protein YjbJ (UPF0337 family)